MLVNNALDISQAYSGAFEFSRLMQALKYAEELAGVRHIKTGAIIANEDHSLPVHSGLSNLNYRLRAKAGELDGVRKKIYEYLRH